MLFETVHSHLMTNQTSLSLDYTDSLLLPEQHGSNLVKAIHHGNISTLPDVRRSHSVYHVVPLFAVGLHQGFALLKLNRIVHRP